MLPILGAEDAHILARSGRPLSRYWSLEGENNEENEGSKGRRVASNGTHNAVMKFHTKSLHARVRIGSLVTGLHNCMDNVGQTANKYPERIRSHPP